MKTIILIILATASMVQAGLLETVWARRGAGTAPSYQPPGWAQSLMYLTFQEGSGLALDRSANGNNTAYLYTTTTNLSYAFTNGAFKTASSASGYAYLKGKTAGNGLTNYTQSLWINRVGSKNYAGLFCNRTAVFTGWTSGDLNESQYYHSHNILCDVPQANNVWQLLTMVRNSGTSYFYLNSSLISSSTSGGNLISQAPWIIGNDPYDPIERTFNGYIDDVYLTGYPCTSAEIQSMHARGHSVESSYVAPTGYFATGENSIVDIGPYKVLTFTTSGTFTPVSGTIVCDVMLVGGGSSGNGGNADHYGAGGAGSPIFITNSITVTGDVSVVVGNGGSPASGFAKGNDGIPSTFGNITSYFGYACYPRGGSNIFYQGNTIVNFDNYGAGAGGGGNAANIVAGIASNTTFGVASESYGLGGGPNDATACPANSGKGGGGRQGTSTAGGSGIVKIRYLK